MAMNPRQPGGTQSLSVNAIGQLPVNPFTSITPGAFPHNVTGVGATGLGPAAGSPGVPIGPRAPQAALQPNIAPNRGKVMSNEPIVAALVTKSWRHLKYEKTQRRGDMLFVRREFGDSPSSSAVANAAQLNEMLRDGYHKLMAQLSTMADEAETHMIFEGSRISGKQQSVIDLLQKYKQEGEVVFTHDDVVRNKIAQERIHKILMYLSLEHIIDAYNFIGIYMSDGGREVQKNITLNVGVGGPTVYQEVTNVWGNVKANDTLFLIITRRKDEETSTPNKNVYREFHITTFYGKVHWPPEELLYYEDDAGVKHTAYVICVGRVIYTPLQWNDNGMNNILLGNTASSEEAFQKSAYANKVEIDLTTARHRRDIYCA